MVVYTAVLVIGAFLLGYLIGKKHGWSAGYQAAEVVVPLIMRQQSLETGKCNICDALWINTPNCESFSRDLDTL